MNTPTNPAPFSKGHKKTPLVYKVLIVLSMMSIIGGSLTGVMTYMNVGDADSFFMDWLNSFLSAFILMPIGLLLMGLITKLVEQQMPNANKFKRNFVAGAIMACIMESMLALSTTSHNIGFSNSSEFLAAWLNSFLAALPLGLALMTIMSITIKPKLELFLKS